MIRSAALVPLSLIALFVLSGCAEPVTAASTAVPTSSPTSTVPPPEDESFWGTHQTPLSLVASDAQTAYPDDYSYAYFADQGLTLVIGFEEEAPASIVAALEATALPYSIVENVGYTYAEHEALVYSVMQQVPGSANYSTSIAIRPDGDPHVIVLSVLADTASEADRVREIAATIDVPSGYRIDVEYEPGGPIVGQPGNGEG